MAPEPVVDYVAAREVAHLVYLNHSKDFWDTVGSLDANYQQSKSWLRINGDFLQSRLTTHFTLFFCLTNSSHP